MPASRPVIPGGGLGHFTFLCQSEDVRFAAETCAELLRHANHLLEMEQFTFDCATGLSQIPDTPGTARCIVLIGRNDRPWLIPAEDQARVKSRLQSAGRVCASGGGIFVLHHAGLLGAEPLTVHHGFRQALLEHDPMAQLSDRIVSHGRRVSTVASNIGCARAVLDLVGRQEGGFLEQALADHLGLSREDQRDISDEHWQFLRRARGNDIVAAALAEMSRHLETVLPITELCRRIGVSPRQLERHFRTLVNETPSRAYLVLRIAKARRLLSQTSLPVAEVAVACGFGNIGTMAKWYRERFGETPANTRRRVYFGGGRKTGDTAA